MNKPDILAVTAALKLACQRRVERGQRVNYFGLVEFFSWIKGVFLVPALGGATQVSTVQRDKPSPVVFLVPAGFAAGAHDLEARARIGGGTELRIGRLDPVLTM